MSREIPTSYENNYMNIQVVSQKNATTKVYLNGSLFEEFTSGNSNLSYGNSTIGDLRLNRNLKYRGSIYNFSLYSELIDQDAVTQNWNYFKHELGI